MKFLWTLPLLCTVAGAHAAELPAWQGYAGNAQHTAQASAPAQAIAAIRWQTPIDLMPQITGGELLIHYASPMITGANTVLLPVKTGAEGGFEIQALAGATGAGIWHVKSAYVLPPHDWTPSFPAQLTPQNVLYYAGPGGTVFARATPDSAAGATKQFAFYGLASFRAAKSAFAKTVMIDTPITSDAVGDIFFGFVVTGANPAGLTSGIARIGADGTGSWISAGDAANDPTMTGVATNCAPAVSADQSTIYIAVTNGFGGDLVGLDATTLQPKYKAALIDPNSGEAAWISADSSAAPTIGPDGDVFYGVLEEPFPDHNDRGWLLHFDATLATLKTPGSFGWDDTVSIVPASAVRSYKGASTYLLMSKYNNYADIGTGNGRNRIAILDPASSGPDPILGNVTVMQAVMTQLGPTPFPGASNGAVYEWCINSAAVDAATNSVFANSEDGHLYRWDLKTRKISQSLLLNAPRPEAYTPTVVGPDGTVYAINNATFYAIGAAGP